MSAVTDNGWAGRQVRYDPIVDLAERTEGFGSTDLRAALAHSFRSPGLRGACHHYASAIALVTGRAFDDPLAPPILRSETRRAFGGEIAE